MEHSIDTIEKLFKAIATTLDDFSVMNLDATSRTAWGVMQELSRQLNMEEYETRVSKIAQLRSKLEELTNNLVKTDIIERDERIRQLNGLKVALEKIAPDVTDNKTIILKWNGQKNALIKLFKQLKTTNHKGEPLLPNSYEDIALFLQQSFSCFSETEHSTILGVLKRPIENIVSKSEKTIDFEYREDK